MKSLAEVFLSFGWRSFLPIDKAINRIKKHCSFGRESFYSYTTKFCGYNSIGENSLVVDVELGYGSYVSDYAQIRGARIGKYTCVGQRVTTINGNHPIDRVSIHPSFFRKGGMNGFSYFEDCEVNEHEMAGNSNYSISIGNDVWVGADARLMEGITIGDGVVVGAGAVVTHDIPPYEVWMGVPAKKYRTRFSPEHINVLEKIKWWDFSADELRELAPDFSDIEKFLVKSTPISFEHFFSIIICTLNAGKHIESTVKSVLEQSFGDFEIIIKDANSEDDTLNIISRLAKNDERIRVISESDKGIYDGMNQAVKLAKGQYVYFLGSGDKLCANDVLGTIEKEIINYEYPDVIYGDVYFGPEDEPSLMRYGSKNMLSKTNMLLQRGICHQAVFTKNEIARKNPFDLKQKYNADEAFLIDCLKYKKRIVPIDEVIAYYDTNGPLSRFRTN